MARGYAIGRMAVLALAVIALSAASHPSGIDISGAWARATAPGQTDGVVYLTITNSEKTADALTGASTPAAKRAELHTSDMSDGMMMMRAAASLPVPAGGKLVLSPGGDHIMLMNLTAPLKRGDTLDLTLTFQRAGDVAVSVPVADGAP